MSIITKHKIVNRRNLNKITDLSLVGSLVLVKAGTIALHHPITANHLFDRQRDVVVEDTNMLVVSCLSPVTMLLLSPSQMRLLVIWSKNVVGR